MRDLQGNFHGILRLSLGKTIIYAWGDLSMLAIEASYFAGGFAVGRSLFQIGAFIARHFSLRNGDLGFHFAVFPMQIEKNEGASAYLGFAIKPIDLGAVE